MAKVYALKKSLPLASLELHTDSEPLCPKWTICNCSRDVGWPRWWEQAHKNERCYEQIKKHELSNDYKYTWVARFRADMDVLSSRPVVFNVRRTIEDIPEPGDVARLIHLDSHLPIAYVKGQSKFPGYGQIDWFWLVRREYASATLSLTKNITCKWIDDFRKSCSRNQCFPNERLQVDWQASHGVITVPAGYASLSVMFRNTSSETNRRRQGRRAAPIRVDDGNATRQNSQSLHLTGSTDSKVVLDTLRSTINSVYISLKAEFEVRAAEIANTHNLDGHTSERLHRRIESLIAETADWTSPMLETST
jgi:hypothetical protein